MLARLTELLKDRRVLAGIGAAVALFAGLTLAFVVSRDHGPAAPPPASQGGLVVQTGRDDDIKLDAKRPLRCFVGGKFVGEVPLDECAKQNGVATGALDVGLDPSGALAASNGASADITPLPPQPVATAASPPAGTTPTGETPPQLQIAPVSTPIHGPVGACWRRVDADWRQLPAELSLNACVQALYAGHCQVGGATYGRWIDQTLRAVPGRIEVSADNRNFRVLVEQTPSCSIPPIG